ncbi:hypothetical protein QJQ45_025253, partial [Haematococcus lacustris]
ALLEDFVELVWVPLREQLQACRRASSWLPSQHQHLDRVTSNAGDAPFLGFAPHLLLLADALHQHSPALHWAPAPGPCTSTLWQRPAPLSTSWVDDLMEITNQLISHVPSYPLSSNLATDLAAWPPLPAQLPSIRVVGADDPGVLGGCSPPLPSYPILETQAALQAVVQALPLANDSITRWLGGPRGAQVIDLWQAAKDAVLHNTLRPEPCAVASSSSGRGGGRSCGIESPRGEPMGGSLAVGSSSRVGGSPPGAQQQKGWCSAVAVMSPWPSDPGPRLCNPSRALNTAFLDELRAESNPSNCEELLSPLLWPSLLLDGGATCQLLRLLCWNHEMTSLYVLRSILSGVFELARQAPSPPTQMGSLAALVLLLRTTVMDCTDDVCEPRKLLLLEKGYPMSRGQGQGGGHSNLPSLQKLASHTGLSSAHQAMVWVCMSVLLPYRDLQAECQQYLEAVRSGREAGLMRQAAKSGQVLVHSAHWLASQWCVPPHGMGLMQAEIQALRGRLKAAVVTGWLPTNAEVLLSVALEEVPVLLEFAMNFARAVSDVRQRQGQEQGQGQGQGLQGQSNASSSAQFARERHGAGTDVVVPGQHSDEGNGPGSQGGRHVGHQPTAHPAGHNPPQQAIHSRDGPGPGADGRPPSMCLDDELCQGPGQAHEDAHEDAQEVGSSGQVQGQQGERGDEEGQGEEPGQSMSSQGSGQAPVEDSLGGPCVQGGQGYELAEEHSGSQGMQDADIEVGDVEGGGSEREGGGHSNLPRFVAGRHRGQRPLVHVRQHHGSMDGVEVLNSEGGAESVGEEEVDEVLLDED